MAIFSFLGGIIYGNAKKCAGLRNEGIIVFNDSNSFQIWVYGGAPKGNFLKEVSLWTPFKNFQKTIFNNVFRSFWDSKELFSALLAGISSFGGVAKRRRGSEWMPVASRAAAWPSRSETQGQSPWSINCNLQASRQKKQKDRPHMADLSFYGLTRYSHGTQRYPVSS